MADINNFKTEILKQLKSEWMSKIRSGQHDLTKIRDRMNVVIEQSQNLALMPGQLPAEWGEPETKKFRPQVIMEEMLFANQVIAYVELKLEECRQHLQRKDPTAMAKMYQRMDHSRLTLYAICPKQADLLLKRIKSAIAAFAQVSMTHKKNKKVRISEYYFRMILKMMNPFPICPISMVQVQVLQKSPAHERKRNLNRL